MRSKKVIWPFWVCGNDWSMTFEPRFAQTTKVRLAIVAAQRQGTRMQASKRLEHRGKRGQRMALNGMTVIPCGWDSECLEAQLAQIEPELR